MKTVSLINTQRDVSVSVPIKGPNNDLDGVTLQPSGKVTLPPGYTVTVLPRGVKATEVENEE